MFGKYCENFSQKMKEMHKQKTGQNKLTMVQQAVVLLALCEYMKTPGSFNKAIDPVVGQNSTGYSSLRNTY